GAGSTYARCRSPSGCPNEAGKTVKVGVLALQGDFEAHARAVRNAGADPFDVRTPFELASADALIIPGGESTTIRKLATNYGLLEPLRERARNGLPILGTCAGMIACARTITDGDEPILGVVDIDVRRNAYGRQAQSFEADIDVAGRSTSWSLPCPSDGASS